MHDTRRIAWDHARDDESTLLTREWLVTNGLGGYASGTLGGAPTRRYHGLLVAALDQPLGRCLMLNQLSEQVRLPSGDIAELGGYERTAGLELHGARHLRQVRFEHGLPIWRFELGAFVIEKRITLVHRQNTVHVQYQLLSGDGAVMLSLRPALHFRPHDEPVTRELGAPYTLSIVGERYEVSAGAPLPPLRFWLLGEQRSFVSDLRRETQITYRVEAARGYAAAGELWCLGHFEVALSRSHPVSLVASTEAWTDLTALTPQDALRCELQRRLHLIAAAGCDPEDTPGCELALAADQFVITPRGRSVATLRAKARGDELRTIIAGYHWFTDWGRDTMISFEGLLLRTGRHHEARCVLHSFAQAIRDGLIPNMFPEHASEGLYHTADATLWFFHAIDRYVHHTRDRQTLSELLPALQEIIHRHLHGTRFGIGVDPQDGLLRQGEEGYQLTWMDAKCDGWVVTPRRGKAVEINALWYNALQLMAAWLREDSQLSAADELLQHANRAEAAFNTRFYNPDTRYLYDVIDTEHGRDDGALRPNQLFAIALPHPVLRREHWRSVVDAVTEALLTPVGLRSLSRDHADYKPSYHGDLRTRDAAYHQGTVWSWLIGPFADAWQKTYPHDQERLRACVQGLLLHLGEAGVGSISEVFDAEAPFEPRGCVAQAWGVAETLRVWQDLRKAKLT
ncbi:MAG: amylo-alpha-1,6-glucosidase [Polyangiales bacterium]